jgi:hypothetical protein
MWPSHNILCGLSRFRNWLMREVQELSAAKKNTGIGKYTLHKRMGKLYFNKTKFCTRTLTPPARPVCAIGTFFLHMPHMYRYILRNFAFSFPPRKIHLQSHRTADIFILTVATWRLPI